MKTTTANSTLIAGEGSGSEVSFMVIESSILRINGCGSIPPTEYLQTVRPQTHSLHPA